MKVLRCHEPGGAEVLRWEEVTDPDVAPDEVLIRVEAAGLNFADLNRRHWNLHHRERVRLGLGSGVVLMGFVILLTV